MILLLADILDFFGRALKKARSVFGNTTVDGLNNLYPKGPKYPIFQDFGPKNH